MVKLLDRVKQAVSGTASSTTLGAAAEGFRTFNTAGAATNDVCRYAIEDDNGAFEIGTIVINSATTGTRTVETSSNSNNALTLTGNAVIFATAAASDLGPTVHSDAASLVAQTGMVVGDTALVTGTNKLYMYTTSGWFLVATMTNTSPSAITGAAATYNLAADGTATVITLAATDPEGFPITFSHTVSTGSLGSTATVSQGTGASANVFTITPSSNSAHAGSFSITFSASDGNSVSQAISAFTLAFGYDMSSATYDNLSFSVGSQAQGPNGMAFNSDRTKMFIVTRSNDAVFQYSLSNGFSLASGNVTYDNLSFSVASQEGRPEAIAFSSDGTKMFIVGSSNDTVYQYSLSNGFSLASGNVTYDNLSFSVASQETAPKGLTFNSDGTKMFIVGSTNDTVYQYSLTNGFSLASGNVTYDNVSFSVASQEANPADLAFNSDGTKMFIIGYTSETIFQYSTDG
jgi:sugar lactone lactonase YvrE